MTAGISTVSAAFPAAGLEADRPTSGVPIPAFYSATDTGVVWRSDDGGTTWAVWALALPEGTTDGDVPVWDATAGLWVPGAPSGGGGGGDASWTEIGSGGGAPAFANGFVNYGPPYATAAYRKDSSGFVHIKGLVKTGAAGAVMFTLPVGYRPAATQIFAVPDGAGVNTFGRIDIANDGTVKTGGGSPTGFGSLGGITFYGEI